MAFTWKNLPCLPRQGQTTCPFLPLVVREIDLNLSILQAAELVGDRGRHLSTAAIHGGFALDTSGGIVFGFGLDALRGSIIFGLRLDALLCVTDYG